MPGKVGGPTRRTGPLLIGGPLRFDGGDLSLGLFQCPLCLPGATRQPGTGGLHPVLLNMEQIRGVMHAQLFLYMMAQRPPFIGGDLNDLHRPIPQRRLQRLGPGGRRVVGGILLQHNEVGYRFDSHQTGLGMMGKMGHVPITHPLLT